MYDIEVLETEKRDVETREHMRTTNYTDTPLNAQHTHKPSTRKQKK